MFLGCRQEKLYFIKNFFLNFIRQKIWWALAPLSRVDKRHESSVRIGNVNGNSTNSWHSAPCFWILGTRNINNIQIWLHSMSGRLGLTWLRFIFQFQFYPISFSIHNYFIQVTIQNLHWLGTCLFGAPDLVVWSSLGNLGAPPLIPGRLLQPTCSFKHINFLYQFQNMAVSHILSCNAIMLAWASTWGTWQIYYHPLGQPTLDAIIEALLLMSTFSSYKKLPSL